jgi:uncharacterized membrane protein YdjX (TVP38/TMEM64 family)
MSRRTLIRVLVGLVLLAGLAALWFSPLRGELTRENVRLFVGNLRGLWYGPLIFIAVFAVACVFAMPASVFCVAAGFIWGWLPGGIYSIIGGLAGAVASFYIGRFIGSGLLERFGRVGRMVSRQVDHAGFRSLLVMRYIPGIPFAVLNYGAGVAGVRIRDYVPATLVGITPPMFVFAYCADAIFNGSMSEGAALKRLLVVCVLMLTIIFLPQAVKRLTRRAPAQPPGLQ